MKKLVYGIMSFLLLLGTNETLGAEKSDFNSYVGQKVLYCSPYLSSDEAKEVVVHNINTSDDFVDDGRLVINGNLYPIDQIFVKNNDGKYENLAKITNYSGIAGTFFVRYCESERLPIKTEIQNLKTQAESCIKDYYGSGSSQIAEESTKYEQCLDDVFYKTINIFYSYNQDVLIKSYADMTAALKNLYYEAAEPDYCYGKCGTMSSMLSMSEVLKIKQEIVLNILRNITF